MFHIEGARNFLADRGSCLLLAVLVMIEEMVLLERVIVDTNTPVRELV